MQNPSLYKPNALFDCVYHMLNPYLNYINHKQKLFAL